MLMALAVAVLVDDTVMFGTLLRSLILLQASFTPSEAGRHLKLIKCSGQTFRWGLTFIFYPHGNGLRVPQGL